MPTLAVRHLLRFHRDCLQYVPPPFAERPRADEVRVLCLEASPVVVVERNLAGQRPRVPLRPEHDDERAVLLRGEFKPVPLLREAAVLQNRPPRRRLAGDRRRLAVQFAHEAAVAEARHVRQRRVEPRVVPRRRVERVPRVAVRAGAHERPVVAPHDKLRTVPPARLERLLHFQPRARIAARRADRRNGGQRQQNRNRHDLSSSPCATLLRPRGRTWTPRPRSRRPARRA